MGSEWAPAVFSIILVLTTGGVILLRPLVKRLGELMDVTIQERRRALESEGDVQQLARRFELLEERVRFTEGLLSAGRERASAGRIATPDQEP